MNSSALPSAEKETERLNKIISALVEHIEALKDDNEALVLYILNHKDVLSFSKNGNAPPNDSPSLIENDKGITMHDNSITENDNGTTTDIPSHSEKDKGTLNRVYSIIEKYKGRNMLDTSIIETGKGRNTDISSIPEKSNVKNNDDYILPATIAASPANHGSLRLKLSHTSFRISHHDTREATAKLLIHFYNGGTARYTTLKSLTGYSIGGIGKLMMNLREKGMIQRTGFQRFKPSANALAIMRSARLIQ